MTGPVCRRILPQLIGLVVGLSALIGAVTQTAAQDFRIDTELFIGDEKEPRSETLTIFSQGMIYDFPLGESAEITMLDTVRGRITLLDTARRVKCGLSTQEMLAWSLALETQAAQSRDPLFTFAAQPKFQQQIEDSVENGQAAVRLTFTAKPLSYSVLAQRPQKPEAVPAFRYAADQFARLNALLPGHLPPAARLELNKTLAERQLIPLEITRTIPSSLPLGSKLVVRTRHLVNWSLSGEDRKKIDRAGTCNAEFPSVSFEEYRAAATKSGTKTANK